MPHTPFMKYVAFLCKDVNYDCINMLPTKMALIIPNTYNDNTTIVSTPMNLKKAFS